MKQGFLASTIGLFFFVAIIAAGTTSAAAAEPATEGDLLYAQGVAEFTSSNFHTAADLFARAKEQYAAAGNQSAYNRARDMMFLSTGSGTSFPYNRSEIEDEMALSFPYVSAAQRTGWLEAPMTATLKSEGETWYFLDTIHNVKNHNPSILREENALAGHTPLYDELMPIITASWEDSATTNGTPVPYSGATSLDIPREELPEEGTLKIWLPVPIESGSQTNVTILTVEPAQYVQSSTGTDADIGLVYLEIPLEEITDPVLSISAPFRFIQHEQRFVIDPEKVLPYNTSSAEYQRYLGSSKNIEISPEITEKARSIVGDETNPYLQAEKIYWDIVKNHPYSHAPHMWLDATGIPESRYVLETGVGDCASQSLYFAALCRSLGIPARATGGYQMIEGTPGTHIWAEFYLEGYGWIPVDVTAAEGGDASYTATAEDLDRYKSYYFGSLDPYRFIIQKSLDLPVIPDPGDAAVPPAGWVQHPKMVCDTCPENPMTLSFMHTNITVTRE